MSLLPLISRFCWEEYLSAPIFRSHFVWLSTDSLIELFSTSVVVVPLCATAICRPSPFFRQSCHHHWSWTEALQKLDRFANPTLHFSVHLAGLSAAFVCCTAVFVTHTHTRYKRSFPKKATSLWGVGKTGFRQRNTQTSPLEPPFWQTARPVSTGFGLTLLKSCLWATSS